MLERIRDAWKRFWGRVSPPSAARPKLTFRTENPDQAPAPRTRRAPVGPVPEEGLLIGAGSFRIDPEKALQTLGRFQLESAEDFLLPWMRCAVACGARKISVDADAGFLEMRFDGDPLAPALVRDPLASLLAEEESVRGRHLAYGLLALLRLEPDGALIESGHGGGRIRLAAGDISTENVWMAGTCLRAFWKGARADVALRAMDNLGRAAGVHGTKLTIGGREIPDLPPLEGRPHLERGPDGLRVICPAPPGAEFSRISLYPLGVRAAVIERVLDAPAQVEAYIRDDRLALNLSQSGVVEGSALDDLLSVLADDVRALVKKAVRDWKSPGQADWLRGVVRKAVAEKGGISGPGVDSFTKLLWEAEVFKSRRGDRLSLKRVAELVEIWGYDIVLGSDETFPAFHADQISLKFLREVFRP